MDVYKNYPLAIISGHYFYKKDCRIDFLKPDKVSSNIERRQK